MLLDVASRLEAIPTIFVFLLFYMFFRFGTLPATGHRRPTPEAKMSRCVTLYRPPPTVEDLSVTAEGMVQSARGPRDPEGPGEVRRWSWHENHRFGGLLGWPRGKMLTKTRVFLDPRKYFHHFSKTRD